MTCVLPAHQLVYHQFDQKPVKASKVTQAFMFEELTKYGQRYLLMPVGRQPGTQRMEGKRLRDTHTNYGRMKEPAICGIQLLFAASSHAEDGTSIRDY